VYTDPSIIRRSAAAGLVRSSEAKVKVRAMTPGRCKLCDKQGDLVQSDIWPRFGYKLYAADQAKGGVFADLKELKIHGKRYTEPLFCQRCDNETLSQHEMKAADWCRKYDKMPQSPREYGEWLLPFVTSLSLRTVLHRSSPTKDEAMFRPAIRHWRHFLLRKRRDVLPYSQHLFIVFDRELDSHEGMCGWCNPRKRFVFTQFGPLWIVALLERGNLSLRDLRALDHSQLLRAGGTIEPVSAWHEGKTITMELIKFLVERRAVMLKKAVQLGEREKDRELKKKRKVM
jgi:hypothetical protein